MKKLIVLLGLIAGFATADAQITYPSAYTTSGGTYTFNNWPAASTAATYPANMRFYRLGTTGEPVQADTIYQDYTDVYSATSATRLNGLGYGGFSFINTGNAVYKMGAAILALNTTNQNNVQVTWTGKTVTPNFQNYAISLYYRVGNTGAWLPVKTPTNDTVRYIRSATAGDSVVKGPVTLPATANNQALVQLCWKYFMLDTNTATGARAQLAVNNIIVSSTGLPSPALTVSASSVPTFTTHVNMASASDSFTVSGSNLSANAVVSAPNSFEISASLTGPYGTSVTLTPTSGAITAAKIYVHFIPTVHGSFAGNITAASTGASAQSVGLTGNTYNATNPAAFVLTAATPYNMTRWDSSSAAGTYPANMMFQATNTDTPPLTQKDMMNNWTCAYNLSSRPRVNGLDTMGFSVINTSSPQYDTCGGGTTAMNMFMGAAVLALNTSGTHLNSVANLSYNIGMVDTADGIIPRAYSIRLQYRIDSVSDFVDVAAPTIQEYSSVGKANGNLQSFSVALPSQAKEQPYIQYRWLYYAISVSGASGSRPRLRIDNISVVQTDAPNAVHEVALNGYINIYPNPATNGQIVHFTKAFTGKVYDIYGRTVTTLDHATSWTPTSLAPGIYNLTDDSGHATRISIQ